MTARGGYSIIISHETNAENFANVSGADTVEYCYSIIRFRKEYSWNECPICECLCKQIVHFYQIMDRMKVDSGTNSHYFLPCNIWWFGPFLLQRWSGHSKRIYERKKKKMKEKSNRKMLDSDKKYGIASRRSIAEYNEHIFICCRVIVALETWIWCQCIVRIIILHIGHLTWIELDCAILFM